MNAYMKNLHETALANLNDVYGIAKVGSGECYIYRQYMNFNNKAVVTWYWNGKRVSKIKMAELTAEAHV